MESLTKNKQNTETIRKMVEHFFAPIELRSYLELTEGFFNVAYLVELSDDRQVILKVAPKKDTVVMFYEKNIMFSEVKAMEMAKENGAIPVPALLGFDDSCQICQSPYFFMEKLAGNSLSSIKSQLSDSQLKNIYVKTGELNKQINGIICPCFGYPGQKELQGENWFPVFSNIVEAGLQDAANAHIELGLSPQEVKKHLAMDGAYFEEVKVPKLVHWDLWDGNIFVKDGNITGLIDWERCIWGDPLLEVGFRTYSTNKDFLSGYGLTEQTAFQERRALWYDIYLLILMSLECEYRCYETDDIYQWATKLLQQQFSRVLSLHIE